MSEINSTEKENEFSEICKNDEIGIDTLNQRIGDFHSIKETHTVDKGDIIGFLNSISDILEEKSSNLGTTSKSQKNTVNDITFALDTYFESKEKENFEWYQRAGKFFFRYEHDLGEEYSKIMKESFETIVKNKMKKNNVHYNITPTSTSVIFR